MQKPAINLGIDFELEDFWQKSAYWARFMSIAQLITLAISLGGFLLFGLAMLKLFPMAGFSRLFNDDSGGGYLFALSGVLLALLGTFIYVNYLHLEFSKGLNMAIEQRNQQQFEAAWTNLARCFRIWGVTTIIMTVMYIGLISYLIIAARRAMEY